MVEKTREYIRGLLSQARHNGISDADIRMGRFLKDSFSMADAVSLLEDKNYYVTSAELEEFIERFLSSQAVDVIPILGIVSNPVLAGKVRDESCWLAYKESLKDKPGFTEKSITETERYARWIVDNLDVGQAEVHTPRRGLVMGSVQSGKTANMCAVMSMAADRGVNLFIVFSGMLNSLRNQTMGRFAEDLKDSLSSHWHIHDFNRRDADFSDVHLETGSSARNLIVCLKNATRLSRLGKALEKASAYKKSMRILIIDDEADQASPDTAEMSMTEEQEIEERSRINKCLVKILFNRWTKNSEVSSIPFGAINYLSYTATPYANVLNEAGKESLYPGDFVVSLPEPSNYFGIRAIFGDGDTHPFGLNVIRNIPQAEADDASRGDLSVSSGTVIGRALAWFICSAAVLRTRGYKKPISMLVNPSSRIAVHGDVDASIIRWLRDTEQATFLNVCRKVYNEERATFVKEDLERDYPGSYSGIESVHDLPGFDLISDEIVNIRSKIDRIQSDKDSKLSYHHGIHVCVDNSASRVKSDRFYRIIYPKKEVLAGLEKAPVFIVIGGSTLSRGLTLDGLSCSYFPRAVHQADTLMQMGRWFGYRPGYELLQRIWMTYPTMRQFRAMARMDIALKKELNRYRDDASLNPSDYGPRITQMPDAVRLRLAARNHMQHAIPCAYDFSGAGYETTEFNESLDSIRRNNNRVITILRDELKNPVRTDRGSTGFVWRNVSSQLALSLLGEYETPSDSTFGQNMKDFIPWMERENAEGRFLRWNIALCGPEGNDCIISSKVSVGCVHRNRLKDASEGTIDIGSLRSGVDAVIDVDISELSEGQKSALREIDENRRNLFMGRAQIGLEDTPLLLVYVIDGLKRGPRPRLNSGRTQIDLNMNIVGLSVIVPGSRSRSNHVMGVHVWTGR